MLLGWGGMYGKMVGPVVMNRGSSTYSAQKLLSVNGTIPFVLKKIQLTGFPLEHFHLLCNQSLYNQCSKVVG